MLQDMIVRQRSRFLDMLERFGSLLQEERDRLQQSANDGKLTDWLIDKKNQELSLQIAVIESGNEYDLAVLQRLAIAKDQQREVNRLKARIHSLESENESMRAWLRSLGKDVSLTAYVRASDFDFVEYDHQAMKRAQVCP